DDDKGGVFDIVCLGPHPLQQERIIAMAVRYLCARADSAGAQGEPYCHDCSDGSRHKGDWQFHTCRSSAKAGRKGAAVALARPAKIAIGRAFAAWLPCCCRPC